jgi:hypothetical protein
MYQKVRHHCDVPACEESLGCTCRWGITAIFPQGASVMYLPLWLTVMFPLMHHCDVPTAEACITVILPQQLSHRCDVQYLQLMRHCVLPGADTCITVILPQQLRHHYDVPAAEASLTGSQ